jgi:hypothetical protein
MLKLKFSDSFAMLICLICIFAAGCHTNTLHNSSVKKSMNSMDIDKELSEWEVFEIKSSLHIAGRDYPYIQTGVRNVKKHFELLRESSTRDAGEVFSCKSAAGECKFIAHRDDEYNDLPSNQYQIITKFQEKDWPADKDQYEARIIAYAKVIKTALLVLPALKKYDCKQPTEVFLNMTEFGGRKARHVVNVDDL